MWIIDSVLEAEISEIISSTFYRRTKQGENQPFGVRLVPISSKFIRMARFIAINLEPNALFFTIEVSSICMPMIKHW